MRRDILLSSLTIGRCFTISPNAKRDDDDDMAGGSFRIGKAIISPSMAWKISATTDEGVVAENVGGESMTFASDTLVVEISREGFERMASRS
ncbi:MAG: hypothetical protein AAFS10_17585 [Myxococcota bacterium]